MRPPRTEARQRNRRRLLYTGLAVTAALVAVSAALLWGPPAPPATLTVAPAPPTVAPVAAVARRETRSTLDPARFVGRARLAHEVARAMPGVLDRLYCYCACDRHRGHRSLLSCYTDGHAAT